MAVRVAPGAVDHVGGSSGVAAGGQEPLEARVDPGVVAVALVIEHLDPNPARARRHADAFLPDDGAQRVAAVPVAVHRVECAAAGGVAPTIGVVGGAVRVVAPVVGLQGRVKPVHARIHPGHDRARAADVQRVPDVVGADTGDVPFGGWLVE